MAQTPMMINLILNNDHLKHPRGKASCKRFAPYSRVKECARFWNRGSNLAPINIQVSYPSFPSTPVHLTNLIALLNCLIKQRPYWTGREYEYQQRSTNTPRVSLPPIDYSPSNSTPPYAPPQPSIATLTPIRNENNHRSLQTPSPGPQTPPVINDHLMSLMAI